MRANWTELAFDDAVEDCSSGNPKILQSDFSASGRYAIVDQGQDLIAGYTSDVQLLCRSELPVIVFGDHTRCFKFVDFPFCLGADGVKVLRPRIDCDVRFLFRYLSSLNLPNAGYSRHFKFLKRESVVLPPIEEQRRIAAILDKADALRQKRRLALQKLDSLTQSIFLDMFGDPAVNPYRFPLRRLGDLAVKFSDGPFGSNLKSEHYQDSGIRVIRLQNIGVDEFIDPDKAYISPEHAELLAKHQCAPGDLLVGTLGDPNLRACIPPPGVFPAINKADCVQVRADRSVATPEFLCTLLNVPSVERMASGMILGQTRLRIAMGRLRELEVPVPPIASQQRYSKCYAEVKKLRSRAVQMNARADNAWFALQHRAFRGEL